MHVFSQKTLFFKKLFLTKFENVPIFNCMVKYYTDTLDVTFMALSDPTRRAILMRLSENEYCVSELAEPFDISLPAVSKHLRILENAGLILREKQGRVHNFQLDAGPMQDAASWIEKYRIFWEKQFDSLEQYLEKTKKKEE